jgi:type II secretory pathway pseudopilin PulG
LTLVELMIVVFLIGLLSVILVPAIRMAVQYRENSQAAHKLRTAIQAFEFYRGETGGYPPDKTPGVTPPEMVEYFDYFDIDWWGQTTEIGGKWDWDNGYHFPFSVSIAQPTKPQSQLVKFDKMVDDGNLSTGKFRAVGGQYHYILEE